MNTKERFQQDPVFAAIVRHMYHLFETYCSTGAGITPSEVREASGLAWQMYSERHYSSMQVRSVNELDVK